MPCVSSSAQRKPKTRKILLKGVSRQPDINIVLVCRAECKPQGLCGFIRVCRSICSEYIFMYHVSHLCHQVFLMLETIPHQLIVAVSNSFYMDVFVSHIYLFFLNKQTPLTFQCCLAHAEKIFTWDSSVLNLWYTALGTWSASAIIVHHAKLKHAPNADLTLSQSAIWFCRMASLCMPITVRISPCWLGAGIICVLFSIKEEIYHLWDIKAEPAALLWPVHWLFRRWVFFFIFIRQTDGIYRWMDGQDKIK